MIGEARFIIKVVHACLNFLHAVLKDVLVLFVGNIAFQVHFISKDVSSLGLIGESTHNRQIFFS
jgi:hypothetical protein